MKTTKSQVKLDLLAWKPLRAVALWAGFPLVLQGAALAVIAALVAIGLGVGPDMSARELMTLRKTNLTTLAVRDPRGVETLHGLANHSLAAPTGFLGLTVIGWAMLALIGVMAWKAWHWVRQIPADSVAAARAGMAGAAVLFTAVLTVWIWPGL